MIYGEYMNIKQSVMDQLNIGVIYLLCDPDTMEIRYVGQTINNPRNRFYQHLSSEKTTHKGRWVSSLIRRHKRPKMIIYKAVNRDDLDRAEIDTIAHLKSHGHCLVNFTDGGSRMSDADRLRLSVLKSGNSKSAKLKISQIYQIYQEYLTECISYKELAKKYECDIKVISGILNGRTWRVAWRTLDENTKNAIMRKSKMKACMVYKIEDNDVLRLYDDYLDEHGTMGSVSRKYNRSKITVRDILKGLTYKNVYAQIPECKKERLARKLADWRSRGGRPRKLIE